jgi:hypothetical protein
MCASLAAVKTALTSIQSTKVVFQGNHDEESNDLQALLVKMMEMGHSQETRKNVA